jgi:hypothetical protein
LAKGLLPPARILGSVFFHTAVDADDADILHDIAADIAGHFNNKTKIRITAAYLLQQPFKPS